MPHDQANGGRREAATGSYCERGEPLGLGRSRSALSMKRTAWKIAVPFARATPVLVFFPSSCTVHLKPVGLAVWTT
jgi:hypothetical protein